MATPLRPTRPLLFTALRCPSSWGWTVLCGLAVWMGSPASFAQPTPSPCEPLLAAAEERYVQLEFAEAESLVRACLAQPTLEAGEAVQSYRLLTLIFLRQDDLPEAKGTVLRLLSVSSAYEPNPTKDPPDYVALVTSIKEILHGEQVTLPPDSSRAVPPVAEAAPTEPEPDIQIVRRNPPPSEEPTPTAERVPTTKRTGLTKWLLIGGGVVAASLAAVVLASGGSSDPPPAGDPFPPPPAFPR